MLSTPNAVLEFARDLQYSTSERVDFDDERVVADFIVGVIHDGHALHPLLKDWKVGNFTHQGIYGHEQRRGVHKPPVTVVEVPVIGKRGKPLKRTDTRIEPAGPCTTLAPTLAGDLFSVAYNTSKSLLFRARRDAVRAAGGCENCGGNGYVSVRIMSDVWENQRCSCGSTHKSHMEACEAWDQLKHPLKRYMRMVEEAGAILEDTSREVLGRVEVAPGCVVTVDCGRKYLGDSGTVLRITDSQWGYSAEVEREDGTRFWTSPRNLRRIGAGYDYAALVAVAKPVCQWAGKTRTGAYSVRVGETWMGLLEWARSAGLDLEKYQLPS